MVKARGINITEVLFEYYSDYKWAVHDEKYSGIVWKSDESHKPTEAEINEKIIELKNAEPMRVLREERDQRLQETDWWACGDRMDSMTNEQKIYRKKLRDLPSVAEPKIENGKLTNVTWPTKPE